MFFISRFSLLMFFSSFNYMTSETRFFELARSWRKIWRSKVCWVVSGRFNAAVFASSMCLMRTNAAGWVREISVIASPQRRICKFWHVDIWLLSERKFSIMNTSEKKCYLFNLGNILSIGIGEILWIFSRNAFHLQFRKAIRQTLSFYLWTLADR